MAGLQVPRLVASYQANFVNGALFFMMCAIASGAAPVSCLLAICCAGWFSNTMSVCACMRGSVGQKAFVMVQAHGVCRCCRPLRVSHP